MKLMLDQVEYKCKPHVKEISVISNRIIKYPVDLSPEELAQEIIKGKTFCPAFLNKVVDGKLKRRIQNWTSQQYICLDFDDGMKLDEAVSIFRGTATFIYTTFSHSESKHKFRVVFVLDEEVIDYDLFSYIMDSLIIKYPQCDSSCRDGSRLFFGGKELIELNYSNRINVGGFSDEYAKKPYSTRAEENGCNRNKIIKLNPIATTKPPKLNVDVENGINSNIISVKGDNIQYIISKDIEYLQSILNPSDVVFHTHEEVYQHLNKQDLYEFLGVSGSKFPCIFHKDNNPSANIFYDREKEMYIYKCFSGNCTFKSGTIRKCVERLLKCNKVDSTRFLKKVYKINYYETDWQKEQKEILDENIRYIKSEEFKEDFPEVYARIKNYIGDLTLIHTIAKDNLPAEHYSMSQFESLFYASVRHMGSLMGTANTKRVSDKLALFAFLEILFKLKEEEIPEILATEAKKYALDKKRQLGADSINIISFFSIPSYSDDVMSIASERAIQYKENHFSMSGWSREMILRALGEDEADRVYPVLRGRKLSGYSEKKTNEIENITLKLIESKGWVLEKEILELLEARTKIFKQIQIKKMIGEMLLKYNLVRVRLNGELKKELNCQVSGYPFVIIKIKD